MKQASVLDGFVFDPFSFQQDGLTAPEVDFGWCQIVDALVVAHVIVVGDEGFDPDLEFAGQIIVLQQDAVLERQMPALLRRARTQGSAFQDARHHSQRT